MKILNLIKIGLATLLFSVLIFSSHAKAADIETSFVDITVYGEKVVPGYINSTNNSFIANLQLNECSGIKDVELLLDGSSFLPTISGTVTTKCAVSFDSETLNPEELQALISQGTHQFGAKVIYKDPLIADKIFSGQTIVADYTKPEGKLSYDIVRAADSSTGYLKIGDKIVFNLSLLGSDSTASTTVKPIFFNSKEIKWVANPADDKVWTATYTVVQGDNDITAPLGSFLAKLSDKAGNLTKIPSVKVPCSIDGSAPKITIESPSDGNFYNSKDIKISFLTDDTTTGEIYVDGVLITLVNGDIASFAEGSHSLEIRSKDVGGNISSKSILFTIDTIAPTGLIQLAPSGEVHIGDALTYSGTSQPNVKIQLDLNGKIFETTTDRNGFWQISVASTNLGVEHYQATLRFIDQANNVFTLSRGSFNLEAKPSVELASSSNNVVRTKTTSTAVRSTFDSPSISVEQAEKVAKEGRVSAAQDSDITKINWSAWIVLFAVIVLASALATAGYYGFAWINSGNTNTSGQGEKKPETIQKIEQNTNENKPSDSQKNIEEVQESIDEEPPVTRW